jgi:Transposase IS66 family
VVTEQVTFCEILPGRGFAQAKKILGAGYAGWLIHDGLRLYYKFLKAAHQSCLFHLIHRCQKMAETSPRTAGFPLAVKQLLEQALALRDRYREKKISLHGMWTATGRLETKLDRLLARRHRDQANQRLAKHLRHERPYLYLPVLSRSGGDQQCGRAGHADPGDDPQELGRQPHRKGGPDAGRAHQYLMHR